MYFKYPLFLTPNFWSRKWEFFIQKLTLKVCPFEKCISAFNHLRSKAKVFMSKVASLNTLLLDPLVSTFPEYVLPCSGIDSLGTKKKEKMICILVQTFLSPIFLLKRKSFGVSSKNVLKVLMYQLEILSYIGEKIHTLFSHVILAWISIHYGWLCKW